MIGLKILATACLVMVILFLVTKIAIKILITHEVLEFDEVLEQDWILETLAIILLILTIIILWKFEVMG